jgi:RsiW-degrading membrane proteinase PrsW (M82 family)
MRWILLAGIPQILLSGLVQEGAKLVPVVAYWRRSGKNIDPRLGLAIGAVAGAGFGIFEAQWAHNLIFASGWTWAAVQTGGFIALLGFWERFFTVAAHTAFSALAGYGLARGWGWQFYLIASVLHGLLNYSAVLLQAGLLTTVHVEIYVAAVAVAVTAWAMWLRWRKGGTTADPEMSSL